MVCCVCGCEARLVGAAVVHSKPEYASTQQHHILRTHTACRPTPLTAASTPLNAQTPRLNKHNTPDVH